MIKLIKTFFNSDVKLLEYKKFVDERGSFSETYNKKDYLSVSIKEEFVQDNQSVSLSKGIIRGLHYQKPPMDQAKLLSVKKGNITDVVLDIRKKSKTYGEYISIDLTGDDNYQLYIPSGFAHGFCTKSEYTEVNYKTSNFYSPENEVSIIWNDKTISVDWKIENFEIVTSDKDGKGINFNELESPF